MLEVSHHQNSFVIYHKIFYSIFFGMKWQEHCLSKARKECLCTRTRFDHQHRDFQHNIQALTPKRHPENESPTGNKAISTLAKTNAFISDLQHGEVLMLGDSSISLFPIIPHYIDGHTIEAAPLAFMYRLCCGSHQSLMLSFIAYEIVGNQISVLWQQLSLLITMKLIRLDACLQIMKYILNASAVFVLVLTLIWVKYLCSFILSSQFWIEAFTFNNKIQSCEISGFYGCLMFFYLHIPLLCFLIEFDLGYLMTTSV